MLLEIDGASVAGTSLHSIQRSLKDIDTGTPVTLTFSTKKKMSTFGTTTNLADEDELRLSGGGEGGGGGGGGGEFLTLDDYYFYIYATTLTIDFYICYFWLLSVNRAVFFQHHHVGKV